MAKSAVRKIKKYVLKNNPVTQALRYKVDSITFRPTNIQLQTTLDNMDMNISDILDSIEANILNRKSYKLVAEQLIVMATKYSSQTLLNEYNIIVARYNLDVTKAKNMFVAIIQMMVDEGLITMPSPFYDFI